MADDSGARMRVSLHWREPLLILPEVRAAWRRPMIRAETRLRRAPQRGR